MWQKFKMSCSASSQLAILWNVVVGNTMDRRRWQYYGSKKRSRRYLRVSSTRKGRGPAPRRSQQHPIKLHEKWQLRGPNVPVSPSFLQPDLALLVHGRRRFLPQQKRRVPGSCLHCYGPLALLMRVFYRRARETVSRLGFVWCRCQGLEQLHYVGIAQNVSLNCIFMNIVKVAMTWLHACSFAVLCVIGRRVSKDPGAPSSTVLTLEQFLVVHVDSVAWVKLG